MKELSGGRTVTARALVVWLALLVGALWAFGALAEGLSTDDPIVDFDRDFADWLHERGSPGITSAMKVVTTLGSAWILVPLALTAVIALVVRRRRRDAILVATAIIGAEILKFGLKLGFARERPFFADPLATESSPSFPSGHASVSLAFYGALAYILVRPISDPGLRGAVVAGACLVVLAIGFSRLYLRVHFLSDVLAGFSAGTAWLILCVLAFGQRAESRQPPVEASP